MRLRREMGGSRLQQVLATTITACALLAAACNGPTAPSTPATPGPAVPSNPSPAWESADAILARCPTPAEVAAGDEALRLSFDYDVTAGKTVCTAAQSSRDLTLLQAQTYRVLTILRRLDFGTPLPWTSKSLNDWLVSSIQGIRYRGSEIGSSFCCDPANTIDVLATLGPNNSGLAALVFPTDFRAVGTLLVLFVHEARHNNGLPHTCADRTRDRTIAELGSWGVQYYLDGLLANYPDAAFISASARAGFLQDQQQVCATRFCEDSCPTSQSAAFRR